MAVGMVLLQALMEYAGSLRSIDVPQFIARLTDREMKWLVIGLIAVLLLAAVNSLTAKN